MKNIFNIWFFIKILNIFLLLYYCKYYSTCVIIILYGGKKMLNYYKILGLDSVKKEGLITDEMVEEAYSAKVQLYLKLKGNNMHSEKIDRERLVSFEEDDFLDLFKDAYYAIRTSDARKHYDELLEMLEDHIQKSKIEKRNTKSIKTETITRLKQLIESSSKGSKDTNGLLKKIMEDAAEKYPIPKGKDENNKDSENEI